MSDPTRVSSTLIMRLYLRCCLGLCAAAAVVAAIICVCTSTTVGWWLWDAVAVVGNHAWLGSAGVLSGLAIGIVFLCHLLRVGSVKRKILREFKDDDETVKESSAYEAHEAALAGIYLLWRWQRIDAIVGSIALGVALVFAVAIGIWECRTTVSQFDANVAVAIQRNWAAVGGGPATAGRVARFRDALWQDSDIDLRSSFVPGIGLVARLSLNHDTCMHAVSLPWMTPVGKSWTALPAASACRRALFNNVLFRIDTSRMEKAESGA